MRAPSRTGARRAHAALHAVLLATAAIGCTTLAPARPAESLGPPPATFSTAALDVVLRRYVDDQGRVDYAGLRAHPEALDRFGDLVAAYSPDATPALFPTPNHALAYWINAYNASVLRGVVAHYPITSVADVQPWWPFKAGFFVFQRFVFGGVTANLYDLEHDVVRARFRDPRVHFALNCASRGCPRLPRAAFDGAALDVQLDQETRRFVAEERNVRIDHAARRVFLSSIFKWYRADFLDWPPLAGAPGATLLDYVARYATPDRAAELARAKAYAIEFVPYDWGLNDQAANPSRAES